MTALQTANHMAMHNLECKDEMILKLTNELDELKNKKGPTLINPDVIALEEQVMQMKRENDRILKESNSLKTQIE
jgi:cell division septal protein FtsQ